MKNNLFFPILLVCFGCSSTSKNIEPSTHSQSIADQVENSQFFEKIVLSEEAWKQKLSDQEFYILRKKGTERPFTGKYWNSKEKGIYTCKACNFKLFDASTKFVSGTGWPSFYTPINTYAINEIEDKSHNMVRTEVVCNRCDSHLGHVFNDGPKPTRLRYCINSIALNFQKQ